jgi:hypothetical protein
VVDEIVVATGCRPNLEMLRELRLSLGLSTEAAKERGPLIDANHYSCGSVPSHGAAELSRHRKWFLHGSNRGLIHAPTFLHRTG